MSINRVNISGHLTRDPELRMTPTVTKAVTDGATQAVEETVQAGTKAIDEVAKKSAKSIEKLEQAANARAKRFMRITKPEASSTTCCRRSSICQAAKVRFAMSSGIERAVLRSSSFRTKIPFF